MNASRSELALVFALACLLYGGTTHRRVFAAGNDASRWAQVESLVDYGRTDLGASRFRGTVDRVEIGGREYSNKPPALALAGAAIYAGLQASTGWRLDGVGAAAVLWTVTFLLVGLPTAALVTLFRAATDRFRGVDTGAKRLLTLALGAGTLLFSFAGTFNNHSLPAFLLFGAFVAVLAGRALLAGAACGLAAAVDLLPGLGLAPFLVAALPGLRWPRGAAALRFVAGFAVGLLVLVASNLFVLGSLWPAKLIPGAVDLSAQAGPSVGGVVLPERWTYPLEILFGGHGLFFVSPVLLLGVAGLWTCCRRPPVGERRAWVALALGLTIQWAGHALLAGSYGGWSYGFRYLVPIQALLLLPAAADLSGARRALLLALLPISVLFAALGAYHPWPPAYEQASHRHPVASLVRNPVGGNAAAWTAEHLPESAVGRALGERFVSRDPTERRKYFALFFGSKGDLATMRRFSP